MIELDYSKLEGIAIGSKESIKDQINSKDIFSRSRKRLSENNILDKVENAAKDAGFPLTLYYDPQDDYDICFSLNEFENACIYLKSDERDDVKKITLPRAIGHIQYEEQYVSPIESAVEVFKNEIEPEVPISYGMYTFLRLRYRVAALFDQPLDFLHEQVTDERKINPDEMAKWRGTITSFIAKIAARYH
jgi:hypothetical protein